MRNKIQKTGLGFLIVLFMAALFVEAQKIETVSGVRFVHNEKGGIWGANPQVKLELVRTIGGLDAEENLSFRDPSDIVEDSIGNLYILDSGNSRIQKLDAAGKFLKTIGRKGQGPGDLQNPISLDIDDQGDLYVLGSQRVEVFSSAGKSLRRMTSINISARQIRLLNGGLIVRGGWQDPGIMFGRVKKLNELLEVVDQKGKIQLAFGEAADYKDEITSFIANWVKFDTDSKKNICLSFRLQNRIDKYSPDGKLLWHADRPLNYGTEVIEKGHRDNHGVTAPKMNEVSEDIAADGRDRIWVITLRRQLTKEERSSGGTVVETEAGVVSRARLKEPEIVKTDVYKLEIFDSEGVLLGEIPLSHHAHGIRIFGDNLFIRENSNTIFYQYKIVEK